ncbi:cysteine protease [Steroidobacter agaridevorans]|uniref:Cysteine protease n=1 Tax=Steroidobacter agaridevorans TaxID=2695856 RepID=A0A829YFX5_9GAMM|nr:cysteine protease [Steroidobacter agaridevorans]
MLHHYYTAPESTVADVDTCKVTARLPLPCKRETSIPRAGLAALVASVVVIVCPVNARAADQVAPSSDVIRLVDAGNFAAAEKSIDHALRSPSLAPEERRSYEFERERMRRILLDFSLTPGDAQARVRKLIPDITDAEFARWDAAGLLESRVIDGQKKYFNRAPSNLFRLSAEARDRRANPSPFNDSPLERPHPHHREVLAQAKATGKSSVAPRRVRITQSITVDADAVPVGETIRAWIPYPRAIQGQQENIRFISSAPDKHQLAPESALQRTVYFEQAAAASKPTTFSVTYELTIFGQHMQIDPEKVVPATPSAALTPSMGERPPHIVFTDAMRKFSREVVGDEKNPYRIAQKLYAAVDRIPWAGALEYSTISNISDYALRAGHADCGQQTLLLMTLLRLNGIPARWQSGWIFSDGAYDNMHDWGWLYLAPYGWVPMDVTFGRFDSGDATLDAFYLGSFDAYRVAFNDDYSQPFVPAKQHFRSETVDLQRGEVEWRGGNLYFDRWDYDFKATLLSNPRTD